MCSVPSSGSERRLKVELNWIGKSRVRSQSAHDVTFSFAKNNGTTRVVIRFSASTVNIKFRGANYLVFAISGNRVYFKESDPAHGYKLSNHGGNENVSRTMAVLNADLEQFVHKNPHIMGTNLKYDATQSLYYVDASDRQLSWKENG